MSIELNSGYERREMRLEIVLHVWASFFCIPFCAKISAPPLKIAIGPSKTICFYRLLYRQFKFWILCARTIISMHGNGYFNRLAVLIRASWKCEVEFLACVSRFLHNIRLWLYCFVRCCRMLLLLLLRFLQRWKPWMWCGGHQAPSRDREKRLSNKKIFQNLPETEPLLILHFFLRWSISSFFNSFF